MAPRPQRNAPLPNAIHTFKCELCDKGYSRQVDYENHLGSYDHNHRQRAAGAKEITAGQSNASRPKGNIDMRKLPTTDSVRTGLGSRFTKIGGPSTNTAVAGSRFKKVGVTAGEGAASSDTTANLTMDASAKATDNIVPDEAKTAEEVKVDTKSDIIEEEAPVIDELFETHKEPTLDLDVAMADGDDEAEEEEDDDDEDDEEDDKDSDEDDKDNNKVDEEEEDEDDEEEEIDWEKEEAEIMRRATSCNEPNCHGPDLIIEYEVGEDGWLKI